MAQDSRNPSSSWRPAVGPFPSLFRAHPWEPDPGTDPPLAALCEEYCVDVAEPALEEARDGVGYDRATTLNSELASDVADLERFARGTWAGVDRGLPSIESSVAMPSWTAGRLRDLPLAVAAPFGTPAEFGGIPSSGLVCVLCLDGLGCVVA